MSLTVHTHLEHLEPASPLSYFQPAYLRIQSHPSPIIIENASYFIPFSLNNKSAISIPKSPFGSFLKKTDTLTSSLASFDNEVVTTLQQVAVNELTINHPSSIYSDFVDSKELTKVGYELKFNDINQHIDLSTDWERSLHKMQSRKLNTLTQDGFEFRKIPNQELTTVHQFLTACRLAQGLEINITLETLQELNQLLPQTYELFGVFRESKMSAVCICVIVSKEVVYYYLPGTSPLFRNYSPMVLLIAGMVDHYRQQGFKYFDLGVSSVEGKPQETLRIFKERMGAIETEKPTFAKSL